MQVRPRGLVPTRATTDASAWSRSCSATIAPCLLLALLPQRESSLQTRSNGRLGRFTSRRKRPGHPVRHAELRNSSFRLPRGLARAQRPPKHRQAPSTTLALRLNVAQPRSTPRDFRLVPPHVFGSLVSGARSVLNGCRSTESKMRFSCANEMLRAMPTNVQWRRAASWHVVFERRMVGGPPLVPASCGRLHPNTSTTRDAQQRLYASTIHCIHPPAPSVTTLPRLLSVVRPMTQTLNFSRCFRSTRFVVLYLRHCMVAHGTSQRMREEHSSRRADGVLGHRP